MARRKALLIFTITLSPPFDHYRDNKAGHVKENSRSVLKWTLSNRQLSHRPYNTLNRLLH